MHASDNNENLLHAVTERVKELTCLYEMSKLLATPEISLRDIFVRTLKLIPPAWQYPEITCCRIIFDGVEYKTPNFEETGWCIKADIIIRDEKRGVIEVYYLEERPMVYEGPFLKEERNLVDALSREMRAIIKRKLAQDERNRLLHEVTERAKELSCLYRITQVSEETDLPLVEKFQRIVELLPASWQYPEITCARIAIDGQYFLSSDYAESPWVQKAEIFAGGRLRGHVEVLYKVEMPEYSEGPFLDEERALINKVAREIAFIIEKAEMATEKAKLQEQLIHSDRLATIGQLAAGVAHELNEPLANVLGFAQLVEKCPGLPEQAGDDAGVIVKAALHAREVIKKLMLFAKKMPPRKVYLNLNTLIQDSLYFLEARCAKASISLVREFAQDLPEVIADPAQITQVVVNLVVNAIQAMPDGGSLAVRTFSGNGKLVFEVEDSGTGMPKEVKKQIFVPFFSTKGPDKGTGLGLSVVHGIIEAHGGEIDVDSRVGRGTRFAVSLPLIS